MPMVREIAGVHDQAVTHDEFVTSSRSRNDRETIVIIRFQITTFTGDTYTELPEGGGFLVEEPYCSFSP
jgi:hypothetical protein